MGFESSYSQPPGEWCSQYEKVPTRKATIHDENICRATLEDFDGKDSEIVRQKLEAHGKVEFPRQESERSIFHELAPLPTTMFDNSGDHKIKINIEKEASCETVSKKNYNAIC